MNEEIPDDERFGSRLIRAVKILLIAGVITGGFVWLLRCENIVIRSTRRSPDRDKVVILVRTVKAYDMEYSKLPMPKDVAGQDSWTTETDEAFMRVFLGLEDSPEGLNPRGKVFYNGKEAHKGRGGLLTVDGATSPRLVDSWGRPYVVVIDADYDYGVIGPNGEKISEDVICYSLGEDGVFDAKDARSW